MAWVFAVPVAVFVVLLVVGSVTGRVRMTSCCAVADPRCDARMRDAFPPERPSSTLPADTPTR
jgi:hypothetical protein